MSGGMPFGPITEYQLVTSKPRMPTSVKVGTSGSCGRRCGVEIASARSLPALMCSQHRRHRVEVHVDLAAEQVDDRLAAALVRDVVDLDVGELGEQRAGEVLRAADAGRGVGHLAGLRLRERDQLGHRFRRHARD